METPEQMIARVRRMADGDDELELSPCEQRALRYVLEQAESAGRDKDLVDYLEIKGLSTNSPSSREDPGIHSWGPTNGGWKGWTVRFLSSEYRSLREAFAALAAWKARAGE